MSGQNISFDNILNNKLFLRFLFAGVVDAVEDIIFVADCEDRIMYANPAALRKFGYTMEEFLGQKSHFFGSPNNPPHITEVIWKETLSKGSWKGEVLNRTKDGVDFPVYLTTGIIRNDKGEMVALTGVGKDISQLKKNQEHLKEVAKRLEESNEKLRKTQRQLINSEKLAALGVFSSGLAHEIGNPITSISALVQLMNRDVHKAYQGEASEHLEKKCNLVLEQVERVSHILDKMRELTHSKIIVKEKVDIILVLEDALDRIKMETHPSNVKILTHVQDRGLFVFVLRAQLRQVFSNILLNSFDSMGKEGNLNINVFQEDNKVVISFQDSGCGIEGEEPERVFEPFYTTKMKKGLGLSVSYSIIQSFGGDIAIQSKKNQGTTVTVKLPVVKGG